VALLTADDFGAVTGGEPQKRARQNVVFELGYFVGVLRRARVAALVESGVETPGDYDGVIWISLYVDWRLELAKEMKAAGLPIDLNDAV
jgi:predicted nucleotide-binding protein